MDIQKPSSRWLTPSVNKQPSQLTVVKLLNSSGYFIGRHDWLMYHGIVSQRNIYSNFTLNTLIRTYWERIKKKKNTFRLYQILIRKNILSGIDSLRKIVFTISNLLGKSSFEVVCKLTQTFPHKLPIKLGDSIPQEKFQNHSRKYWEGMRQPELVSKWP